MLHSRLKIFFCVLPTPRNDLFPQYFGRDERESTGTLHKWNLIIIYIQALVSCLYAWFAIVEISR